LNDNKITSQKQDDIKLCLIVFEKLSSEIQMFFDSTYEMKGKKERRSGEMFTHIYSSGFANCTSITPLNSL
jgi:hypothetical protein